MHARISNIDSGSFDILVAAQTAQRRLGAQGADAPRSLEEAIANLEAVTNRILERQRALEDAQRRLKLKLAAVADDIEQGWQALEQQLTATLSALLTVHTI